jgi:hypothetical protein
MLWGLWFGLFVGHSIVPSVVQDGLTIDGCLSVGAGPENRMGPASCPNRISPFIAFNVFTRSIVKLAIV